MVLVCILLAFAVRYSLTPLIVDYDPFMFFAPAALISAWYGGICPGVAAWLLGILVGDFFFTGPAYQFGPYGPVQITLMSTYSVETAIGIGLIAALHRLSERVHESAEEAHLRGERLERAMAERKRVEESLREAQADLSKHAANLELRVAERTAKLKQSFDDLERLLYSVAHDLRAPLRAMEGFTTLLLKQYAPQLDATGQDYTRRVAEAATRMDQLILDLLAYGRLSHVPLSCDRIELRAEIYAALAQLSKEVQARKAEIQVEPALPAVLANPVLLEQILVNLLSNALKFVTPETKPQIQIRCEKLESTVRLWIQDNGIGIAPEHHEKIFQLFQRLHGPQTYSGTGLGLAIVAKGMERMGGRTGVDSISGQGSRFWLELPAAPPKS
jgi:signal transduction histidine kinase